MTHQPVDEQNVEASDLVILRRKLHRIPEVGLYLPLTQQTLREELEGLPVELHFGKSLSSLVAVIAGARPGPTVLLRSDMDALPVREIAPVAFASDNGAMHACGHDLHMAALVGAVRLLCARREVLAGTVVAVFQPGEEGHGGAEAMIGEGLLALTGQAPVASYGVHVFSFLQSGVFLCRNGVVLGSAVNLALDLVGTGGHAARPHVARNPILVGSLVVQAIQAYATQTTSPGDPVVVTVASFQSGDAANVIPERALLRVSIRATTTERVAEVEARINSLARSIALAFSMTVITSRGALMPPTISDPEGARLVREVVTDLFGPERFQELVHPEMVSEDFSYVLDVTGGAFVFVGARGDADQPESNHSPRVVFDDGVIDDIARLLAELATRRLAQRTDHEQLPPDGFRPTI
ncbi:MAG: Hippurate hydrolase [Naasia sp.]|nr:Hippurate hydrolase [Naasia sp.]